MRIRNAFALTALLLGLAALAGLAGCTKDGNEWQRLVCEVQAINGGAPLVSAYLDAGSDKIAFTDDDVLPIDIVPVTFHARPYNSSITSVEDFPYSYFHITGYDLIWHPLTPGSEQLESYNVTNASTDILVPVNEEASGAVLIADRYMKDQPWFAALALGAQQSFTATCELRFHGHETGSDDQIDVVGSFMVTFVGVVVED